MRLLRNFPALAFALVFLSIVALALAQQSITLLLVAGALAAISWYVTEGPRGRSLPKWVSHILVVAVALYTAAELMQGLHDVHGVLGRFGLWLTLIKLYERSSARDHGHLLMLSFLLMLVACLQATGLLFSIILIAYVVLGVYVLLLYQLYAAHERARRERQRSMPAAASAAAAAVPAPLPPVKPIFGQHMSMNFRALVAGVGMLGLLLGTLVFVAFPRGVLEDAIKALSVSVGEARTGFVEEVNLMRGGRITDSRRSVMTVELLDQAGEPIQHYEPLRLRGGVLDRYEGFGHWRPSRVVLDRFDVKPNEFTFVAPVDPHPGRTLTQVVRSRSEPRAIFSMYVPVAVSADRAAELAFEKRTQLLLIPDRKFPPLTYRIRFQPVPSDAVLEEITQARVPGERQNLHLLRSDEVRDLANRVLEDANYRTERPAYHDDPVGYWRWAREVAHMFTRYLQSPEFRYTLDLDFTIPSYDDPIRYFLFEAKRGHCEFFASAMVALCENVGVQSRLITGYLATEYNDMARRYEVLERNAHAWVEVRTGDHRWTAFDPTPPAAIQEITNEPTTFAERLQSLYDRFDAMWSHNVLAFDARAQKRLMERNVNLTEYLSTAVAIVGEWFRVANAAFSLGPAGSIYLVFVSLVLVLAVFVLAKLIRRRRTIRRRAHLDALQREQRQGRWEAEYQRLLRDAGFYLDMLEALERLGVAKPPWMPPLAFAEQLAQRHPSLAGALREMAALFYRSRYGLQPLTGEEVAIVKARIASLSTAEESP